MPETVVLATDSRRIPLIVRDAVITHRDAAEAQRRLPVELLDELRLAG